MAGNLITQLICVSGVNRLSSVCLRDSILILMLICTIFECLASVISVNKSCAHYAQSCQFVL